jgi:hypothetical protein
MGFSIWLNSPGKENFHTKTCMGGIAHNFTIAPNYVCAIAHLDKHFSINFGRLLKIEQAAEI